MDLIVTDIFEENDTYFKQYLKKVGIDMYSINEKTKEMASFVIAIRSRNLIMMMR